MKLEVGQKIGIYEALSNVVYVDFDGKVIKGRHYLGDKDFTATDGGKGKALYVIDRLCFVFDSEVLKVASLTVKSLK